MKICGYRLITRRPDIRINIRLAYCNHWLTSWIWRLYVPTGLLGMVREQLMWCLVSVCTHVFFNNSCIMAEYLASKNPQYYYNTIPVESVVLARQKDGSPIEIQGCMKQHFLIFRPYEKYFCKEYLCDHTCVIRFSVFWKLNRATLFCPNC